MRRVEERQRRRCGSRAPARRASRAARPSRARRGSTSRPRRRRAPRVRDELAEVGGDVRRVREAAVDAAEAARAHEADPDRAAGGERAADRRRADGALRRSRRRGRAARPCARRRVKRPSSSSVEPDAELRRRGRRSSPAPRRPSRTRRSLSSPTATPSPGGKPCATSVVSSATTGRRSASACADLVRDRAIRSVHGIAPSCATQRAAASSAELRPADEVAGRERVAGAGRVDDARPAAAGQLARRRSERRARRASAPSSLPASGPPMISLLVLVREDDAGRSASSRSRKRSGPKSRIALHEERSTLTPRRAARPRAAPPSSIGARSERVAGQVEVVAAVEPARVELVGAQVGRDAAVGGHRALAVGATSETTTPVRPVDDGPGDLDAVRAELARAAIRPASSSAALADEARLAAELRAQAATFAAWPPGAERASRASRRRPSASGCVEPDDHVEQEVAEAQMSIGLRSSHGRAERRRSRTRSFLVGGVVGASAAIAAARRLRPKRAPRETPAGLAAFEEAPCYRELVERERATRRSRAAPGAARSTVAKLMSASPMKSDLPTSITSPRALEIAPASRRLARPDDEERPERRASNAAAGRGETQRGSSSRARRCSCRSRRRPRRRARAAASRASSVVQRELRRRRAAPRSAGSRRSAPRPRGRAGRSRRGRRRARLVAREPRRRLRARRLTRVAARPRRAAASRPRPRRPRATTSAASASATCAGRRRAAASAVADAASAKNGSTKIRCRVSGDAEPPSCAARNASAGGGDARDAAGGRAVAPRERARAARPRRARGRPAAPASRR